MNYTDEVAVSVCKFTLRMKLLRGVKDENLRIMIKKLEAFFTSDDIDVIYSRETQLGRTKTFLDLINKRLTTGLFIAFWVHLSFSMNTTL